ncbi:MAG: hypothetical protein RIA69_14815 [Cyclobacteriaceae bacterium]
MFKPQNILLFAFVIIIFSCATPDKKDEETQPILNGVMGSWKLNKYIDHSNAGTEWISYDDSIIYEKHITDSHFTWFKYDKKNDNLLGMGGGNYIIKEDKYIEKIDFFYPPGSSELGQAIPFEMTFNNGEWYHKGMAKVLELDIESGQMEEVGMMVIEEVWLPMSVAANQESELQKTWDLDEYRTGLELEYIEYPDFTGYIKLITPTHFIWTKYDKEGDEIYGAGSGTYLINEESYIENIKIIHPENTGQVGSVITFEREANENKWKHFGYVPEFFVDEKTGQIVKDSILIDEYWVPHEIEVTQEIFF